MATITSWADMLMAELWDKNSPHWGTDSTIWSMLIEDVQSLDPDRVAKSYDIMRNGGHWNKAILANMLALLRSAMPRYANL